MNKYFVVVGLTVLVASNTLAQQQHDHQAGQAETNCCQSNIAQQVQDHQEKSGGMMNHEQMMAMHKHMSEMQETIEQLKVEVDPHAFDELMEKHQAQMKKGMEVMMSGKMMKKDMSSMNMDEQLEMMGMHMEMMNKMMEQMMTHGGMLNEPKLMTHKNRH